MILNFDNTITLKYAPAEYLKLVEKTYLIDANISKVNENKLIYLSKFMSKDVFKSLKL